MVEVEAIKVTKARYCRFLDTKDWKALRDLFTHDCRFLWLDELSDQHAGSGWITVDQFLARLQGYFRSATATSVHHVYAPEILLTGHGRASGIWAMDDYVVTDDFHFRGYGHYRECYRKVNGHWRIASWELTRIRVDPL